MMVMMMMGVVVGTWRERASDRKIGQNEDERMAPDYVLLLQHLSSQLVVGATTLRGHARLDLWLQLRVAAAAAE